MVPSATARLRAEPPADPTPLPLPSADDAVLVRRALSGEPWAHEAIFRKHVEYINALSLRLLRDRAEAEDVVQDTFLEAFRLLAKLEAPARLRAWLGGIAVHQAHRRFRRRRWLTFVGLGGPGERVGLDELAHQSLPADLRAMLMQLDAVLVKLPEAVRAAWLLRYVEGYRFDEIASACRCSLATAKRRVTRAHARVRQQLDIDEVADG